MAQLTQVYEADPDAPAVMNDCRTVGPTRRAELFRATRLLNVHAQDPQRVAALSCLLRLMQADGTALPLHHQQLHGALVALRSFEAANALRDAHQLQVPELPSITGAMSSGRQILRLHNALHAERETVRTDGWQVIAIVHPWCGPSRRATAALATDPALDDLRQRLQLVVPDAQDWPIQQMLAWNAAHPALPMTPMLRSEA